MGGKPSPPTPPDPQDVARAQTSSNIGTAIANAYIGNANTTTPLGSVTYNKVRDQLIQIPGGDGKDNYNIPIFQATQTLSPDQMQLLNLQEATGINLGKTALAQSAKIGNLLGTSINPASLPGSVQNAPDAPHLANAQNLTANYQSLGNDDYEQARRDVENAIMSRLNPQVDHDRAALQSRLANQGVTQGSEAYNQAIDELNRQVTDQRMQAVLAGGQEQSRLFGMDQSRAGFNNQVLQQGIQDRLRAADFNNQVASNQFGLQNEAMQNQQTLRQQALQEQIALRNQPISEISALLGSSQPTMPSFQPFNPPHISDTPVGQYMYNTAALNQQNYQSQLGASNAAMGGMFGLGSSIFSALPFLSDRRAKENIEEIGTAHNGLPIYVFNYIGGGQDYIGFMADDVEKVHPEAVLEHPSGLKMVDYRQASKPVEQ